MVTWIVISPDMWGHVHADCLDHTCPRCVTQDPETGVCTHDDDRCDCGEWENNRHACGEIEALADADDSALVAALVDAGFLSEKGREIATIDDYSDGFELDILDDAGRKLFVLQRKEEES